MDFGLSEEQQQLKSGAREFVAQRMFHRRGSPQGDGGSGGDAARVVSQDGGTGMDWADDSRSSSAARGWECSTWRYCSPKAATRRCRGRCCFPRRSRPARSSLAARTSLKRRWLPALADGSAIGTLAIVEENDGLSLADISAHARKDGARLRVERHQDVRAVCARRRFRDRRRSRRRRCGRHWVLAGRAHERPA